MPLTKIRPTEETHPVRVREVVAMLSRDRAWTQPICVEGTINALLDGHHRLAAALELGLARVPVHIFDYDEVDLFSWRPDFAPTRSDVLERALSGDLYPHKTTRHRFPFRPVNSISLATLTAIPATEDMVDAVAYDDLARPEPEPTLQSIRGHVREQGYATAAKDDRGQSPKLRL